MNSIAKLIVEKQNIGEKMEKEGVGQHCGKESERLGSSYDRL